MIGFPFLDAMRIRNRSPAGIRTAFFVVLLSPLAGCTYVEAVFVTNSSAAPIEIIRDDISHTIEPGDTKKVRGLHLTGVTIVSAHGSTVSYSASMRVLFEERPAYAGKYICTSFIGGRIDVHYSESGQLQLMPCAAEYPVVVLNPDTPAEED